MAYAGMDELGAWLDEACDDNHLPDLRSQYETTHQKNHATSAVEIRAIRSRLVSLGYLAPEHAKGNRPTQEFREAIVRFQKEAGFTGIEIDGWAGPKTRQRLQQLVSFEEDQHIDHWDWLGNEPSQYPALARAVYLRLYTLGFLNWKSKLEENTEYRIEYNQELQEALAQFLYRARVLDLTSETLEPNLDRQVLQLLFEHDAIIRALANHPDFVEAPENSVFIDAIGRVELWMFGYDIPIGGPLESTHTLLGFIKINDDAIKDALNDFDKKFSLQRSTKEDEGFNAAFFAQISQLNEERHETDDLDLHNGILERAAKYGDLLKDALGKIASRIWDGAKRLWAWLKKSVQSAWKHAKDEMWNLARFIANGARDAYHSVLKAIDILHHGISSLGKQTVSDSEALSAVLMHDKDFDIHLFINTQNRPEALQKLLQTEAQETRYLVASCQIIQALLSAMLSVAKSIALGPGMGWFALLLSLSRITKTVNAIKDAARLDDYAAPSNSLLKNPIV